MKTLKYPFNIRILSAEDGGGFLVEFPDLPGCMADGDTIEEAIEQGQDAVKSWLACAKENNDPIPKPSYSFDNSNYSGRFVQRVPKSLHRKLQNEAKREGVSVNSLVLAYISEGLGTQLSNELKERSKVKQGV